MIYLTISGGCRKSRSALSDNNTNNPNADPVQYDTTFADVSDPSDVIIYQVNIRC